MSFEEFSVLTVTQMWRSQVSGKEHQQCEYAEIWKGRKTNMFGKMWVGGGRD